MFCSNFKGEQLSFFSVFNCQKISKVPIRNKTLSNVGSNLVGLVFLLIYSGDLNNVSRALSKNSKVYFNKQKSNNTVFSEYPDIYIYIYI